MNMLIIIQGKENVVDNSILVKKSIKNTLYFRLCFMFLKDEINKIVCFFVFTFSSPPMSLGGEVPTLHRANREIVHGWTYSEIFQL